MCENGIDKHAEVQKWILSIFGDEPVPFYHKSDAFISHLYELMTRECRLAKDVQVFKDFNVKSVEEYSHDLASTVKLLNKAGLERCIESAGAEANILTSLASTLSLSTLDENSYILALTDLMMEKEHTTEDVVSLNNSVRNYTTGLSEAARMSSRLESVLDRYSQRQADDADKSKKLSQQTAFLDSKAKKYKSDQNKQEQKLSQSGFSRNVTHGSLMDDYEELLDVESKLLRTQKELDKFAALPPDIELARVKVEVARAELRDIEDELAKEIDISHL